MIFEQLTRVVFGSSPKVTVENALLTNAEKQFKIVSRTFEICSTYSSRVPLLIDLALIKSHSENRITAEKVQMPDFAQMRKADESN